MIDEQCILDCYRSDIDELDHIIILKNGETLFDRELLEKMEREPEFDIFTEVTGHKVVGYDKVFDGKKENRLTVDDIKNMIDLGILEDKFGIFNNESKRTD